jgi:hypothetical protein
LGLAFLVMKGLSTNRISRSILYRARSSLSSRPVPSCSTDYTGSTQGSTPSVSRSASFWSLGWRGWDFE